MRLAPAVLAAALVALVVRPASGDALREVRLVMGTTVEVRAGGDACSAAIVEAFAAIARVDERMSLWKESELLALDRNGTGVLSEETLAVLRHALLVAEASGGAFDPTVEPLVRAAGGFGDLPVELSGEARKAALARVDYRRVTLLPSSRTVRLEGGARVVLDGIAKGYAADRALQALRAAGATTGLVDIGGSSLGVFGEPLVLELRDPTGRGAPWGAFVVEETSVSTSGGDQRPGHILDPRTGEPARSVLAATVVAASGMEADALSTAVFVMGAEEGLALLVRRGAAGLVLVEEEGRRTLRTTPAFAERFALKASPGVAVRAWAPARASHGQAAGHAARGRLGPGR